MSKLRIVLPFIVVLALLAAAIPLFALFGGAPFVSFNPELEGARILAHRARLLQGEYPPGYDFFFAGTSRTMADFTPGAVADVLNARCHADHAVTGYDLGNVADDYAPFYAQLRRAALPRLLVLEFMPLALLEDPGDVRAGAPPPADWLNRDYRDYKISASIFEAYVTGGTRELAGLGDLVNIRPGQLVVLAQAFSHGDHSFARLYYMLRSFQGNGYGSRLAGLGQVYYRSYLPDRRAADLIGQSAGEYQAYTVSLQRRPSAEAWQSFVNILDLFGPDRQVVVVRPPVDPAMYALEQRLRGDVVASAVRYLQDRGIAYIDLNPGDYHSTDLSHIDWYDTARLSHDFAQRLVSVLRPGLFGPGGCS